MTRAGYRPSRLPDGLQNPEEHLEGSVTEFRGSGHRDEALRIVEEALARYAAPTRELRLD